ncbi:MAG: 4Fe-4S binding protein [Dehalococcoidales bacterium]|nr:4Fe-4S binding protein [Dehalococcoidales bacterium]
MKISRKDFLKGAAGAIGLLLMQPAATAMAKDSQTSEGMAMLIDVTKCVSCWWCYAACKDYNNLPETGKPSLTEPPELSSKVWTTLHPVLNENIWTSRKKACNHCTDAACVQVCPTGALSYNDMGFVQYDQDKCSGCGYCAEFCPFGVPQMDTNKLTGVAIMNKCTFCHDRVTSGEQPACAAACTTGAITYGKRADLVAGAKARVAELEQNGVQASTYGINELDGLHVMYVLNDSPEVYGMPAEPETPPTGIVRNVLSWLGGGLAILAVAGFGLNYLAARFRMRGGEKE